MGMHVAWVGIHIQQASHDLTRRVPFLHIRQSGNA
ncbi:MAG: hypothetical protein QOG73_4466, partial [Acetobacteraceae bacterium]|nr:hypothetical protein [Acetobacteraceae bacterium]